MSLPAEWEDNEPTWKEVKPVTMDELVKGKVPEYERPKTGGKMGGKGRRGRTDNDNGGR